MENKELKPCPFCVEPVWVDGLKFGCNYSGCILNGHEFDIYDADEWNTRTDQDSDQDSKLKTLNLLDFDKFKKIVKYSQENKDAELALMLGLLAKEIQDLSFPCKESHADEQALSDEDKKQIAISPSGESVNILINEEWKRYYSTEFITDFGHTHPTHREEEWMEKLRSIAKDLRENYLWTLNEILQEYNHQIQTKKGG